MLAQPHAVAGARCAQDGRPRQAVCQVVALVHSAAFCHVAHTQASFDPHGSVHVPRRHKEQVRTVNAASHVTTTQHRRQGSVNHSDWRVAEETDGQRASSLDEQSVTQLLEHQGSTQLLHAYPKEHLYLEGKRYGGPAWIVHVRAAC